MKKMSVQRESQKKMLSIILPVYNEEDNLSQVHNEISLALDGIYKYEIIFVDDASKDSSRKILENLSKMDPYVRFISHEKNLGQTAALNTGVMSSQGNIIVFLDADGQSHPFDILPFVEKLSEGHDLVFGRRKKRKDSLITKKIPSYIANFMIRKIFNAPIHDIGCALKVMNKEVLSNISLKDDAHRYLPLFIHLQGGQIFEMETKHRKRLAGKSKYGLERITKVIKDLVKIYFKNSYTDLKRPYSEIGEESS